MLLAIAVFVVSLVVLTVLFRRPKPERIALRVERAFMVMERAADAGNWPCALLGVESINRETKLYLMTDGASAEHLREFMASRGLVRSVRDPEYWAWINREVERAARLARSVGQ